MGFFDDMYKAFEDIVEKARVKSEEIIEKFRGNKGANKEESEKSLSEKIEDYGNSIGINEKPKYYNYSKNNQESEGLLSKPLIDTLMGMEEDFLEKKTGVDTSTPTLPDTLNLKEKEYVPVSEKEMQDEALRELLPTYEEKVKGAEERFESKSNTLNEKKEETLLKESEEKKGVEESYQSALQKYRDKMIFQGLTNSTIADGGKMELANALDAQNKEIEVKYDRKYLEIENSLKEAQTELSNALELYDLNFAADLQEKINKLKLAEEKRVKEINDYNLSVREKESAYQIEKANKLYKLQMERQKALFEEMKEAQELEKEYGVSQEKREEYFKREETAKSFYSQFSKEQASKLINEVSEDLLLLLGPEAYLDLYMWNARR